MTKPTVPDTPVNSLAGRRRAAGLTQRQLATLAGCSLSMLANLEAGCVPRRSGALDRIQTALSEAEARQSPTTHRHVAMRTKPLPGDEWVRVLAGAIARDGQNGGRPLVLAGLMLSEIGRQAGGANI